MELRIIFGRALEVKDNNSESFIFKRSTLINRVADLIELENLNTIDFSNLDLLSAVLETNYSF